VRACVLCTDRLSRTRSVGIPDRPHKCCSGRVSGSVPGALERYHPLLFSKARRGLSMSRKVLQTRGISVPACIIPKKACDYDPLVSCAALDFSADLCAVDAGGGARDATSATSRIDSH